MDQILSRPLRPRIWNFGPPAQYTRTGDHDHINEQIKIKGVCVYYVIPTIYKDILLKHQLSNGGPQLVPHHGLAQVVANYDFPVDMIHTDTRRSCKRGVNLERKS